MEMWLETKSESINKIMTKDLKILCLLFINVVGSTVIFVVVVFFFCLFVCLLMEELKL